MPKQPNKLSPEDEHDYAIAALMDIVEQHCPETNGEYESGFLSANAGTLRLLCKIGAMKMLWDGFGRGVRARFKSKGKWARPYAGRSTAVVPGADSPKKPKTA